MRGYSELYRMGGIPSDGVAPTFARVEAASQQMTGLVEELLTLARLDEGRDLQLVPVNLTDLINDAAADLHALDPTRQITTTLETTAPVMVPGDGERLRQALTNLVGNVARHTPIGSPCELALAPNGKMAQITIIDHGPGITPDDEARIFERFYRADNSRSRESGGSGLGLAIVAAIVAAHHGTVAATPTPGGGLTITLQIPLLP